MQSFHDDSIASPGAFTKQQPANGKQAINRCRRRGGHGIAISSMARNERGINFARASFTSACVRNGERGQNVRQRARPNIARMSWALFGTEGLCSIVIRRARLPSDNFDINRHPRQRAIASASRASDTNLSLQTALCTSMITVRRPNTKQIAGFFRLGSSLEQSQSDDVVIGRSFVSDSSSATGAGVGKGDNFESYRGAVLGGESNFWLFHRCSSFFFFVPYFWRRRRNAQ